MTKIREPLSTEHVLSNVIKKLDENDIKNITNKSVSHFRKCSDPDDKDHNLYFDDAIKLDILMQKKGLGTPFLDNFGLTKRLNVGFCIAGWTMSSCNLVHTRIF